MPRPEQLPEDLRKLCDQQARKIGDTQERRKSDLEVLIRDIRKVAGLQPQIAPKTDDESVAKERSSWFRIDAQALAIAFVLTLPIRFVANHAIG